MSADNGAYSERTIRLLGADAVMRLQKSRVIVVGLGGVGGHCAEALARAGVGSLHLVDCDVVTPSNLNRQLIATKRSIGQKKVDCMRERLNDVSDCVVTVSDARIDSETIEAALPQTADFLVDAIDTMYGKLALVSCCRARGIPMISSMGAGNRLDPTRFAVTDVYETQNCPLARRMRHELRKMGVRSLPVVASTEVARANGAEGVGSLAPVTAAAGLCLAAFAIDSLIKTGVYKGALS